MKRRTDTIKIFLGMFLIISSAMAITADDQRKGSKSDMETTRSLREKLMYDRTLSTYAHNISIITLGNNVTLRGKVKNKEESMRLEEMVKKHSPDKNVINQLTINKRITL